MSESESQGGCSKHGSYSVCGHTDATCPDTTTEYSNHDVAAVEKFKSPNFIREETLEKTLERLKKIEPSKRKIIVYVGVHPNEGTDALTAKYASQWAEKYGATIVCQPTEETPHGIWVKHEKETAGDVTVAIPSNTTLDEADYADKFSLDNKEDTFVIRFHGTPLGAYRQGGSERSRGLDVVTSRHAHRPVAFKNPNITKGLEEILRASPQSGVENTVHAEDPENKNDPQWYQVEPNILLVEYFYEGKPVVVDEPYFKALIDQENKAEEEGKKARKIIPSPLSEDNWQRQMNVGPSYLNQDTLSDEDIATFDAAVVKDFEKILGHISSQLVNSKKLGK